MKLGIILFVLSMIVSAVLISPKVKLITMNLLMPEDKEILSQMEMVISGTKYKILKIKTREGLAAELYKFIDGETMFLDKKKLSDKQDAFYKFGENKHNLFLKDINNDGVEEIILPSLDKNMKARLNVFSLDPINEVLTKQTTH